jgi:hypothetical protein
MSSPNNGGYFDVWPANSMWIVILAVNGGVALLVLIICLWFYARRRPAREYSQRIGIQMTSGEIVNPMNTGPGLSTLPPYSVGSLPVYSATVLTSGNVARTGTGEELVLVPRSALMAASARGGASAMATTNVTYYNLPRSQPAPIVSHDQSMNAIREASGVYMARPPPPSTGVPAPLSPPLLSQPLSQSHHHSSPPPPQHRRQVPGEEDAPELDEDTIRLRTHAANLK